MLQAPVRAQERFAVSTAFLPLVGCSIPEEFEKSTCPPRCHGHCKFKTRLEVQMERYQRGAVFGVLENKLLVKLVLRELRIPHTAWHYGALIPPQRSDHGQAVQVHPTVPWYERARLVAAMRAVPEHRFVLKPLTEGGTIGVTLMDEVRWQRLAASSLNGDGNATAAESLADLIERRSLLKKRSDWNQEYEHRGVILEERYDGPSGSSRAADGIFELKTFVVFGVPTSIRLIPQRGKAMAPKHDAELVRDMADASPGSRYRCLPNNSTTMASVCEAATAWINDVRNLRRLDDWAMRIGSAFGADWFRLDIFAGDARRGWVVNEVTSPSHLPFPSIVWTRYARRYADRSSWKSVPEADILGRISAATGLPATFLTTRSDRWRENGPSHHAIFV